MSGWMGLRSDLLHVLRIANADHDAEGNFYIDGTVITGLGGEEIVIDPSAHYYVCGRPLPLATLMNNTSYGLRGITVI